MDSLTDETLKDILIAFAFPALAVGVVFALWRLHGRRWTTGLLTAAPILGSLYVVANILIATDYRDADGFTDCWPGCSVLQDAVKFAFFYGGALLALIALFSIGALVVLAVRGAGRAERQRPD